MLLEYFSEVCHGNDVHFLCLIFISVRASFLNVKYFWRNVASWRLEKQVAWRNGDWSVEVMMCENIMHLTECIMERR